MRSSHSATTLLALCGVLTCACPKEKPEGPAELLPLTPLQEPVGQQGAAVENGDSDLAGVTLDEALLTRFLTWKAQQVTAAKATKAVVAKAQGETSAATQAKAKAALEALAAQTAQSNAALGLSDAARDALVDLADGLVAASQAPAALAQQRRIDEAVQLAKRPRVGAPAGAPATLKVLQPESFKPLRARFGAAAVDAMAAHLPRLVELQAQALAP
jgi:hypothetical protein